MRRCGGDGLDSNSERSVQRRRRSLHHPCPSQISRFVVAALKSSSRIDYKRSLHGTACMEGSLHDFVPLFELWSFADKITGGGRFHDNSILRMARMYRTGGAEKWLYICDSWIRTPRVYSG